MSGCSDECSVFTTSKGGVKLFKDGFTYEKSKVCNDKFYWTCEHRRKEVYRCRSTLATVMCDGIHKVSRSNLNHNHEPDPTRKCVSELKEKMKSESLKSRAKASDVLRNVKDSVSVDVLECLPSTSALKQAIYRHKRKNAIKEFDQAASANAEMVNENFIIKDRRYDTNERILMMATPNMMSNLSRATYWVLDGISLEINTFERLYTVHGNVCEDNKKTFPLCIFLCSHTGKHTYDTMFGLLREYGKEHNLHFAPKVCLLDFDKAAVESARSNFEGIHLQGCHFHFAKIIYKQVQELGFAKRYASDVQFNRRVKSLLALAFLEEFEIYAHFDIILNSFEDPDWQTLAHWFGESFVNGASDTKPEHPPSFWSSFESNKMGVPRTHSSVEAWRNKVMSVADKTHPGVKEVIEELMKEASANEWEINNILKVAPHAPAAKKKMYSDKENKINRILENKSEYTEEKLLSCIAVNL